MQWWRAYSEALHDPKVIALNDRLHRAWFNLLCVASKHGGVLPALPVVSIELRVKNTRAAEYITALVTARLFDEIEPGKFAPHNWNSRQYKSDVTDPTNAERQKRYRKRHPVTAKTVTPTVTDKRPDTDSETEAERKKERYPADAGSSSDSKYVFESGVIRLKKKDFLQWKQAFSHLDLAAELVGMAEWASTQAKWFPAVSGALAKKNREISIRKSQQNGLSNDEKFYGVGRIPGVL